MTSDDATETLQWREQRARLVAVWSGGSALRPLPDQGVLVIGRGAECDLRIDSLSVSRTHAALRVRPGQELTIEDLGSSNGTRLNGKALEPGVASVVGPADIVEIGAARILVECPDVPITAGARSPQAVEGAMAGVRRLVGLVAPSDISVILCGETGVGKELAAEAIHQQSPRAPKPLVCINCAALSDALLESELFGHERGAFTGAVQTKVGLLEAASGGTVFLDEIGELPLGTQAKLLRALESRELQRVGGLTPRAFDVRFVAATNRDLKALSERGMFRSDLYFRLNGITIRIPPLRERPGEIPGLAAAILEGYCAKSKRVPASLTPAAIAHLESYAWPGNVRELRNVLERSLVLSADARIGPEHLAMDAASAIPLAGESMSRSSSTGQPPTFAPPTDSAAEPLSLKAHIGALERQRIIDALAQCGGNQTKAARQLGISRRTLLTRLDEWGVPRPRK